MITLDIGNTRTRRILVLAALGMGALVLGIWWPWGQPQVFLLMLRPTGWRQVRRWLARGGRRLVDILRMRRPPQAMAAPKGSPKSNGMH